MPGRRRRRRRPGGAHERDLVRGGADVEAVQAVVAVVGDPDPPSATVTAWAPVPAPTVLAHPAGVGVEPAHHAGVVVRHPDRARHDGDVVGVVDRDRGAEPGGRWRGSIGGRCRWRSPRPRPRRADGDAAGTVADRIGAPTTRPRTGSIRVSVVVGVVRDPDGPAPAVRSRGPAADGDGGGDPPGAPGRSGSRCRPGSSRPRRRRRRRRWPAGRRRPGSGAHHLAGGLVDRVIVPSPEFATQIAPNPGAGRRGRRRRGSSRTSNLIRVSGVARGRSAVDGEPGRVTSGR